MDKTIKHSVCNELINTEHDKSNTMDNLGDGDLAHVTMDLTCCHEELSPAANQINSPNSSFFQGEVLLNVKNEMNYDQQEEGACALVTQSDQLPVKSPSLNSPNEAGDSMMRELYDNDPENGNPFSFENVSNEECDILNGDDDDDDDDSFGLDTLFDESLQCEDTLRGVTDTRKRSRVYVPEDDSESDNDTLGLKNLFDEDLQSRDAVRWVAKGKHKAKLWKRNKRKRKKHLSGLSDDDDIDIAAVDMKDSPSTLKKKPKRIIPNYFIAIRVSNPVIHSGVKIVQDSIVSHDENLKPALIPLATLHLTLLVLHLEDEEKIQKATEVLHQCRTSLEPVLLNSALTLNFAGLDNFRHQVLFVKLCGEEGIVRLNTVANVVRDTFAKEGIPSTDSREFSPHLTVMKLTRSPKLRKRGIRKIPLESYATWTDFDFGEERPVNVATAGDITLVEGSSKL
ncbi:unnamed protein product [Porites lobata]|uniref:A-kinase anchor protein 7-like phosphoesterase domain-containing protein n=1 Tax=Porites lobata TaxID=104759 RepID=A0ABN8N5B2_9CNID|nr:unnamed protein product [Porites lobata]